jgi:hypothetical protein
MCARRHNLARNRFKSGLWNRGWSTWTCATLFKKVLLLSNSAQRAFVLDAFVISEVTFFFSEVQQRCFIDFSC